MSTTIRVSKRDKEALEALRRRLGAKTMAETLRKAIALAAADDDFVGDTGALGDALRSSRSSKDGGRVSEQVDEELAKAVLAEEAG
jgi:Ribbon-helix-helix protein, copG family